MESLATDLVRSQLYFFLCLFLPGFLTSLCLNLKFKSILSHIVCGFCLSLILSQVFVFVCVTVNLDIANALYLTVFYCTLILLLYRGKMYVRLNTIQWNDLILISPILLIFVFIMIVNGGLLSENSDAWWHMSYAKKISDANSIFLNRHHLSGVEITSASTYLRYLPGWHLILALIHQSSGISLAILWHNLSTFLIPITLTSYFIFARALTQNTHIALLSIILFCITLGGLNSYFRVSPWPGNVAYILWYFLYYLAFRAFNQYYADSNGNDNGFKTFAGWTFRQNSSVFVATIIICYLILSIHASELFWFAISFVFYYLIARFFPIKNSAVRIELNILQVPVLFLLLLSMILFVQKQWPSINADIFLCIVIVLILGMIGFLYAYFEPYHSRYGNYPGFFLLIGLFVIFINYEQFYSLFHPVSEKLSSYGYHHPYLVDGIFNSKLWLPQWEHQLREGLLFSGLASILIAAYLIVKTQERAAFFLFANAYLAFFTLCSPYLFTYLNAFTPHTSTYRVQLLVFHPIVIGYFIYFLSRNLFVEKNT